ncbi:MAG: ATP-dependent RNA helicase HrpA [Desulfamplus sp.]|nr:ATP-dependent RNA helicase HrpA [Desulfamplus sp.]
MNLFKKINQIEKLADQGMCRDRRSLVREIIQIKKMLSQGSVNPGPGVEGPGLRAGLKDPGLKDTGTKYPGTKGPGLKGPGLKGPGLKGPGREDALSNLGIRMEKLRESALNSVGIREQRHQSMPRISYIPELPITDKKDEIIEALKGNQVVIISGETGSGKTTQIPKFCMAAGQGRAGAIGCTQPRRIAAINVAARIAEELGIPLGHVVGYKIRFDDRSAGESIIKVMTDGILLAETQRDPWLNGYDTIIVDEAHERSLNIDFTLGILRNLIKKRRDIKVVITSATIDTEKFSTAFDGAPVIEVSGRMYPVEVRYLPVDGHDDPGVDDQGYVEASAEAVDMIQRESRDGDILIFMPTEQDITDTMEILRGRNYVGVTVLPLYARLSAGEQAKIFHRGPGRKIIVSTNVAETSLTIPGIKYVVDTGLARIPHYSPRTRTTALPVTQISRSSADQRKGRCGRVANGICIRLYHEDDYASRSLFTSPEILRSNLAEVILRMISLKLGDAAAFPFIDPPSSKSIKDGIDTLLELGAVAVKQVKKRGRAYVLTDRGRIMAGIPVDPKLSRILIEADDRGCLGEAVVIASALSISDPRQRPREKAQQADQKHALFKDPASDFVALINIWNACQDAQARLGSRAGVRKFCNEHFLSFKRIREWMDIHGQIRSVLNEHGLRGRGRVEAESGTRGLKAKEFEFGGVLYREIHKSILSGYLSNIAYKKDKNLYHAARGQRAMIFPGSGLFNGAGNWIVAAEYVETSLLFARTVATIDPGWLEELGGDLCTRTWSSPHWEKKRGEVVALEQVSLFGLVIVPERRVAYGKINPSEAGEIFIRRALVEGEVSRPFPFMEHNRTLMEEVKELEEKTRRRDILATGEDIYNFYMRRLGRDFYDIRTFAKYLRDKGDDGFLHMTMEDLRQREVDDYQLEGFPDSLSMGSLEFPLEYDFDPGSPRDGVTIRVPMDALGALGPHALEWLVPGLFREKITALIRNLPKAHRVKLMPVSEKADIIAGELPRRIDTPLFAQLSAFVRRRFKVNIPVPAWSGEGIDDHLKMRISLRGEGDGEVAASRSLISLKDMLQDMFQGSGDGGTGPGETVFESAKRDYGRKNITRWDMGVIPVSLVVDSCEFYPGLKVEQGAPGRGKPFLDTADSSPGGGVSTGSKISGVARAPSSPGAAPSSPGGDPSLDGGTISLTLFKNRETALASHVEGVRALCCKVLAPDINALKKDIRGASRLEGYAAFFGGRDRMNQSIIGGVTARLFSRNIRDGREFETHIKEAAPLIYATGQTLISQVTELCRIQDEALSRIKGAALKNAGIPWLATLARELHASLESFMPRDFLEIYSHERLEALPRYIAAMKIRLQRAEADPSRDQKKADQVALYVKKLEKMVAELTPETSKEKADAVENFFWMIEEYKVSLFAQELKTPVKISPKRLDMLCSEIGQMI